MQPLFYFISHSVNDTTMSYKAVQ